MPGWSALLRILLCAAMLLNAAGTAIAAVDMHAHAPMPSQAVAEPACHDDGMAGIAQEQPPAPAPECCDDGACTTCTSFAHALPPQLPATAPAWATFDAPPALAPGHASAALQRLIRPPIG